MELRVGGQRKKPKAKQDFGLCVGGQLKNQSFLMGGELHRGAAASHHFFRPPFEGRKNFLDNL